MKNDFLAFTSTIPYTGIKNLYKLQIFEIPWSFLYQGQLHPQNVKFPEGSAIHIQPLLEDFSPPSPPPNICHYGDYVWLSFEGRGRHHLIEKSLFTAAITGQQHL